jgi:type 1 fimbria pilin
MHAITRILITALPMAALLLSPALATAHPDEDFEVIVDFEDGTIEVAIANSHEFAINCETSIDGGPVLTMTVAAEDVNATKHTGVAVGEHTVTWSCPTDANGATNHGGGTFKEKFEDSGDSWF